MGVPLALLISLCIGSVHAAEVDEHAATIRSVQARAGAEVLVVFMGHSAARLRPELEARLDGVSLRWVETAGGGWDRLETRRLLAREGLDCGVYLCGGASQPVLAEIVGSCGEEPEPEPSPEAELDVIDGDVWRDTRGIVDRPRSLTVTGNLAGVALPIFRRNVELRLGRRHGLMATDAISVMMGVGHGVGYRVYPVGSFDSGLQLAVEAGGCCSSPTRRSRSWAFWP